MIWSSWQIVLLLVGTGLSWAVCEVLLHLNRKLTAANNNRIGWKKAVSTHALLKKLVPFDKYLKSLEYAKANFKFGLVNRNANRLFSFIVLATCAYPLLFSALLGTVSMPIALVAVVCIAAGVDEVLFAPLDAYDTFKIEEKFGFNTQTVKTWLADKVKGLGINCIISSVTMLVMYYGIKLLLGFTGFDITSWKFVACMTVGSVLFSLLYEALWINVISPLFNKFTPLEDKELDGKIKKLIADAGFAVSGIYVMDASKRSKHGNAYFAGFGKLKRIVLYDVLLKTHTSEEILAILAHEVGHLVHKDLLKERVIGTIMIALNTFLTVKLITTPAIYNAFGFNMVNSSNICEWYVVGFYLAATLLDAILWPLELVGSKLSRSAEYRADAFAKSAVGEEPIKTGLIKLHADSLVNLNVHKLMEAFYYSHPTLRHRLEALSK